MFEYYDLQMGVKGKDINIIFPNWEYEKERVGVFCPHDDDGLLGAGYMILAVQENGAEVYIFIFCNGQAGYSKPEDKIDIIRTSSKPLSSNTAYMAHSVCLSKFHLLLKISYMLEML